MRQIVTWTNILVLLGFLVVCGLYTAPEAQADSFTSVGSMVVARAYHTQTLLPNGKILIAGGYGNNGYAQLAELYDPATGTFTATGYMTMPRYYHTATLLPNGKVLIAGGVSWTDTSIAELYDPATGTFTATGTMTTSQLYHTATLLPNGKVLLAGGQHQWSNQPIADAELYDPATGTFTSVGSMACGREYHTATLLANGKVLVAGGDWTWQAGAVSAETFDPSTGTFTATSNGMTANRSNHSATALPNGKVLIAGGNLYSAELYDPATDTFTATGSMPIRLAYMTATLLPNGTVMIAGGFDGNGGGIYASAEIYDPAAGVFTTATASMATPLMLHGATLLPNGQVLIAGGTTRNGGNATGAAEVYDSSTPSFTRTVGNMTTIRSFHTSTLLPNGKILIAGGMTNDYSNYLNTAELYDPATGTFTATGNMSMARGYHTATLLTNGKVLIAGGYRYNNWTINSPELYDPVTGTFSPTGSMTMPRNGHSAVLLRNGKVLVAGGYNGSWYTNTAELFDPATGSFTATSHNMTHYRGAFGATLLSNGQVLIMGGQDGGGPASYTAELYDPATDSFLDIGGMVASVDGQTSILLPNGKVLISQGCRNNFTAQLYDPTTGTFSATTGATKTPPSPNHTYTLLPNGKVLSIAGYADWGGFVDAETYDPITNTFTSAGSLPEFHQNFATTLLPNGKVLVSGGNGSSADLYDQGLGFRDSQRPVVTALVQSGAKLTLTGTNLTGASEGSSSSTYNSATNFPLVQLQRVDNAQQLFLLTDPTTGWSANSASVVIPSGIASGPYLATVFTNAVPSQGQLVNLAPAISVSPSPYDFGAVYTNTTPNTASQTFTFTSTGAIDYNIAAITTGGAFSIDPGSSTCGTLPAILAAGASCTVSATFTPTAVSSYTGTLAATSNDSSGNGGTVALTGAGILKTYPLTVAITGLGNGTVSGTTTGTPATLAFPSNGSASIILGAVATLTPVTGTNSSFTGWSGCDSVTGNQCTVTMATAKNVSADFASIPGAPTAVSAVAGNIQATVTFTAPVITGGVPITAYTVTAIPGGLTATGTASPIVITGLAGGTPYTFTVKAANPSGTGPASAPSVAVTPYAVPAAPTGVKVTAGNTQAAISFIAPTYNGGKPITAYTVTSTPGNFTATGTASPLTVTGLTNGLSYAFTVTATNFAGPGAASAAASATPYTIPGSPTAVSAVANVNQASVSFTPPASNGGSAITGYSVTTNPGGLTTLGTSSPINVLQLTAGTAYTFTVKANNIGGSSAVSAPSAAVTPYTVPGAPTAVSAVAGKTQATVSFTAPASNGYSAITSYTVTAIPGGLTATGTASPIVITGLSPATATTFTVRAYNAAGSSFASTASAAVIPYGAPGPPTITTVTAGNGQVTATFVAPASNGGQPITNYTITSNPDGKSATVTASPAVITGLTNGQIYNFTVTATNIAGAGTTSAASSFATPRTVPDAPINIRAVSGLAQASVVFSPPVFNGGSTITSYTVLSTPGNLTASGTSSPLLVKGLVNGTTYTFAMTATNAAGTSIASAASNSITPIVAPGAPTAVVATATAPGTVSVAFTAPLNYGGSFIAGYTVTSSPGNYTAAGTANPLIVTGLVNGTAYTFTVKATNIAGTGFASAASNSATPSTIPGTLAISSVTPGNGQVTATFAAPTVTGGSPITGYTVTSNPGSITKTVTVSPAVVTGLTNGTAYTFTVAASNVNGAGPASLPSAKVIPITVPGAPTVTAVVGGNASAQVTFTAPASNGGSAITGYTVVSTPGGIKLNGSASPMTVTGLTNGISYTFTVTANNAAGSSAPSVASTSVIPYNVPGAPTAVTAVAGNAQAIVSFTAPVNNGGNAITSYTVATTAGGFTATGTSSPIVITGLTNGAYYAFAVKATNAAGSSLVSASTSNVMPFTTPGTPTAVKAIAGNGQVTLNFTAPANNGSTITGYTVATSPGNVITSGTSTQMIITGLTNGTAYTFIVAAKNGAGCGPASAPSAAVTPVTVPGAPTGITALAGNKQATVNFTAPASTGGSAIVNYTVTAVPGYTTMTGTASPITMTGLTPAYAYTFSVKANTAFGSSLASVASAPVTPYTTPGAPTITTVTAGNTLATVAFTAPAATGGQPVTSYTITSNPGNITATVTASPAVMNGLTNGQGYTFTISGTNIAGTGALSAASAAVTPRTAPGAPTSIVATAGLAQASVAFVAPTFNGGSAITSYTVVSTPGNLTASGTASPIIVKGLTGGAYSFTVTATNVAGSGTTSVASNSVNPIVPPGAPTAAIATPTAPGTVSVAFTAPANNGGSVITGYTVTSVPGGITVSGTANPLIVTGLVNGTAYTFTVKATNIAGSSALSAASTSVSPFNVPGAPTAISAVAGNGQATVSFTAPASNGGNAITSYTVTSTAGGFTATGTASPIVVTGLTNGAYYAFTVKATNAAGNSLVSASTTNIMPFTTPNAPTAVKAITGNGQATVSFTAPANNGSAITKYTVTTSPGNVTTSGTGTQYVITGLINGTAYTFTVTATNAAGDSIASASSATVTPTTLPSPPTGVSAYAGDKQATISFAAPSNGGSPITSYTVTASPGYATTTGTSSPIVFNGLVDGTTYSFSVKATTAVGTSGPSVASNTVVPRIPQ